MNRKNASQIKEWRRVLKVLNVWAPKSINKQSDFKFIGQICQIKYFLNSINFHKLDQ